MEFNKDLYELSKMNYAFSKKNGLDEEILLKQKRLYGICSLSQIFLTYSISPSASLPLI